MSQSDETAVAAPRGLPEVAKGMGAFGVLTLGFIALMATSAILGFVFSGRREADLMKYNADIAGARIIQQALVDAETGVRGFILTRRADYLEPYFFGLATLDRPGTALQSALDEEAVRAGGSAEPHPLSRRIADLRGRWLVIVSLPETASPADPDMIPPAMSEKQVMDDLRSLIAAYMRRRSVSAQRLDSQLEMEREVVLGVELTGALIAIIALVYFFIRSVREIRGRAEAITEKEEIAGRLEQMFAMTSTLQCLSDREDAHQVLRSAAISLLPGFSGLLYVFNSSQDRLDLSASWGEHGTVEPFDHFAPASCWALKRGMTHRNNAGDGALRCAHLHEDQSTSLEIPMAARGQVFGLLVISRGQGGAEPELVKVLPIATALADAMSLALSSLTLRDLLRNQALRDALTGLYNRRFLDEMLAHLSIDAKRRRTVLCLIMIDLDYFKQLNDQYGHATGDAVLREVASVLVHSLRASDIACRYGGEELAVLLPDCSVEMAVFKAEQLRARIAEVAPGPGGAAVTASLGVGAIPDTSSDPASLLASADAALYQAKLGGRNRVVQAERTQPRVEVARVPAEPEGLLPA